MTKNEKREAVKVQLAKFAEVVASWTDAELAVQVRNYSISSPRNAARKIVNAEAAKRA
jgi:hypothetical protein